MLGRESDDVALRPVEVGAVAAEVGIPCVVEAFVGTLSGVRIVGVPVKGDVSPRAKWIAESEAWLLVLRRLRAVGGESSRFSPVYGPTARPHGVGAEHRRQALVLTVPDALPGDGFPHPLAAGDDDVRTYAGRHELAPICCEC